MRDLDAEKEQCHGLVPWSVTLASTPKARPRRNATGLSRGSLRSFLKGRRSRSERNDPPHKAVAFGAQRASGCRDERKAPRHKAVASRAWHRVVALLLLALSPTPAAAQTSFGEVAIALEAEPQGMTAHGY